MQNNFVDVDEDFFLRLPYVYVSVRSMLSGGSMLDSFNLVILIEENTSL